MNLLVCTSKKVLLVNGSDQRTLLEGRGIYAGLTWDRHYVYVAERAHMGAEKCDEEAVWRYRPHNGGLLKDKVIGLGDLHDVHDLYWRLDDEILYMMESGTNQIRMWGTTTQASQEHLAALSWGVVIGSPADEWMTDINHINSFWSENGKFYVVEHNRGASRVIVTDEAFNIQDVVKIGIEAHNVMVKSNRLVVCSSREGRIYEYDLIHRRLAKTKHIVSGWYPRGLAVTTKDIWVGLTAFSKERGMRNDGPSRILRMNHDFKTLEDITLEDTGQIVCLRLLSADDLAHNRMTPPEGLLI